MEHIFSYLSGPYSQFGEDGALIEIFRRLGVEQGSLCEFGAQDATELSNSRALIEAGWRALLIEPEPKYRSGLKKLHGSNERVKLDWSFVERRGENSLDAIFKRHGIAELDLLSIDIDSDDLPVWRSLKSLRPKVVVIEYNPTIPFDTRLENPEGRSIASSALSIAEYGASIGYRLVAGTGVNLIFADEALCPESLPSVSLQEIYDGPSRKSDLSRRYFFGHDRTLLWQTADGTLHEEEVMLAPWSRGRMIQPLPRRLRVWPPLNGRRERRATVRGVLLARPQVFPILLAGARANFKTKFKAKWGKKT